MTKAQIQTAVFTVFVELIKEKNKISWQEIGVAVREKNIPVKNWLHVRGVLQYFIDQGHLRRTNDLMNEDYIVIPK